MHQMHKPTSCMEDRINSDLRRSVRIPDKLVTWCLRRVNYATCNNPSSLHGKPYTKIHFLKCKVSAEIPISTRVTYQVLQVIALLIGAEIGRLEVTYTAYIAHCIFYLH